MYIYIYLYLYTYVYTHIHSTWCTHTWYIHARRMWGTPSNSSVTDSSSEVRPRKALREAKNFIKELVEHLNAEQEPREVGNDVEWSNCLFFLKHFWAKKWYPIIINYPIFWYSLEIPSLVEFPRIWQFTPNKKLLFLRDRCENSTILSGGPSSPKWSAAK